MSRELSDHIGHTVYSDEMELWRYPVMLTTNDDGGVDIEVDYESRGEYLEDDGNKSLWCSDCDCEVIPGSKDGERE